jgi:hypothetical protein
MPNDTLLSEVPFQQYPHFRIFGVDAFSFFVLEHETEIFIDSFLLDNQVPDARGYCFFDSTLMPFQLDYYYMPFVQRCTSALIFGAQGGFWPIFDLVGEVRPLFSCFLVKSRRQQGWKRYFGCFRGYFYKIFTKMTVLFFVSLTLVGVGYFCEITPNNYLKLVVSNTNDLVVIPPAGIFVGCRPAAGESLDAVSFFFCGWDYQLLRNFAQAVRTSVQFNIYEYQGLLFSQEKKVKKITKRNQK